MKWWIGVDGGGTKTAFALAGADGLPVRTLRRSGCSYQTIGVKKATALVTEGIKECLSSVGAGLTDCAGCCVGMPCYGEDQEKDREIEDILRTALSPASVCVVNDVEVGWAGSLECREGVHIVAGTGSIAFGRGKDRRTARCGGWNEFFGDEGSCYWIGRRTMELFSKEADGRAVKGALYELVRKELGLTRDYGFIDVVLRDMAPYREKVADFQRYALAAAQSGDAEAVRLYEAAAGELAGMAQALKEKLLLSPGRMSVSYSGGLFHAGELILKPLRDRVEEIGGILTEPRRSAVEGALLLAAERFRKS